MRNVELYKAFDPLEVLPSGDPRCEPLDHLILGAGVSLDMVALTIAMNQATDVMSLQALAGLPGSGKSTLLNRLPQACERLAPNIHVLRRDLSTRIQIGGLPTAGELLGLVLLELTLATQASRGVSDRTAQVGPTVLAFFAALRAEDHDAELVSLTVDLLRTRMDGNGRYTTRLRESNTTETQELLLPLARKAATVLLADLKRNAGSEGILLVLDGIEKAVPQRILSEAEAEKLYDQTTTLYKTWIPEFRFPCHLLVTAPPGLFAAQHLSNYHGSYFVSMVRIRDHARAPNTEGEDALIEVIRRRHPDAMRVLFGDDVERARRVVRLSGGFLRELIRLIREALIRNLNRHEVIPWEIWLEVIDRHTAEVRQRVLVDSFGVLRKVDRDSAHRRLQNFIGVEHRVLARLLDQGVILGYQNGELWCDLHPALIGDVRLEDEFLLPQAAPEPQT